MASLSYLGMIVMKARHYRPCIEEDLTDYPQDGAEGSDI